MYVCVNVTIFEFLSEVCNGFLPKKKKKNALTVSIVFHSHLHSQLLTEMKKNKQKNNKTKNTLHKIL